MKTALFALQNTIPMCLNTWTTVGSAEGRGYNTLGGQGLLLVLRLSLN